MREITKACPWWQVLATVRDAGQVRPLLIQVDPCGLELRQKGRRRGYSLPWGAIYELAAVAQARENARAKREAKKAKKEGR